MGTFIAVKPYKMKDFNIRLDMIVYGAVTAIGGGTTRQAIIDYANDWNFKHLGFLNYPYIFTPEDISTSLRRLQTVRRVFSHDSHGTLTMWGGIKRGRFWSTRAQLKRDFKYTDEMLANAEWSQYDIKRNTSRK